MTEPIRLTQFSHGAGCGCKLSPQVLEKILAGQKSAPHANLIVGNDARDDAGAYDLGDGTAVLTTTDFFMPIVDDPFDFGRIASANAISDIYAMGGSPMMAIAILGWPIDKLAPEVAGEVLKGSRSICAEAGIALAGGHSIDSPEPIFGLSVNGRVSIDRLKKNGGAHVGDVLFLTKAIGVGILSTAEKRGLLRDADVGIAAKSMMTLNAIGEKFGAVDDIHAMTDVTGFGLLGHLGEMCAASNTTAVIDASAVQQLTDLDYYLDAGAVPGGTKRNLESYRSTFGDVSERQQLLLADPQTSGGLLVAVSAASQDTVSQLMVDAGLEAFSKPIGRMTARGQFSIEINA